MKIALDLDEVVADFLSHMIDYYNSTREKNLSKKDFYSYNFWEIWGGTREEAIKIADEFHSSEHFEKINPLNDAIKSIKLLAGKNDIFIITARPKNWKAKTEEWLQKHLAGVNFDITFAGDFHAGQGKSKAEICADKGIKVILEDNKKYALECAEKGIYVLLFDHPWNQKVEHKNIIRVRNWQEALAAFNKISL